MSANLARNIATMVASKSTVRSLLVGDGSSSVTIDNVERTALKKGGNCVWLSAS
jgi:hypothetical protein